MGESELNPGFPFPDCGPDFEKAKADGIELGVGEIGPGEERTPEGMEKRIGEAVQKQSEGVGIERMAGGPVAFETEFEFLDVILHLSPAAVCDLVDDKGA